MPLQLNLVTRHKLIKDHNLSTHSKVEMPIMNCLSALILYSNEKFMNMMINESSTNTLSPTASYIVIAS